MFANWCIAKGECPLPASPRAVAAFVSDISMLGPEKIWDQLCQIRREHYVRDLPDPCIGPGPVSEAFNRLTGIKPPRSWCRTGEAAAEFLQLPYPCQLEILRLAAERDKEVRRLQNETAELRKGLEKLRAETVAA